MPRQSNAKRKDADEELTGPVLMFEELDGLLGYRLRRAQGAMHRDYMATVTGLDLTQKHEWTVQSEMRSGTKGGV